MGLFDQLTEKPWLPDREGRPAQRGRSAAVPAPEVGLRVFLAVATVLFTLFVAAYFDRMALGDWRALSEPWLLWLNTLVLVFASIAMQRARRGADRGRTAAVRSGLFTGGALALAFLLGQILVWQDLVARGAYAAANPANAFFYLLTAVHGVHLLGGLVAWARTMDKLRRGAEAAEVRMSVGLCAVYWHFLLMIWVVLFALLLWT